MSMNIFINRDPEVRLADGESGFRRFWKQICKFGDYVDQRGRSEKMVIDRKFADEVKKNFDSGKYGVVAVPLGHPITDADMARDNRGEVMDLKITSDGIDALIEIRDDETAEKIEKRLIPDVSMGFVNNYLDKKTGNYVGTLLKHVGLVVDPYIKEMNKFVSASDDNHCVIFSDIEPMKGEDEMEFEKVKNDRDFDVEVKYMQDDEEVVAVVKAGEEIEVPIDQVESVKAQIAEAVNPEEGDDKDDTGLSDKEKELADKEKQLSDEKAKLEAEKAEIAKQKAALKKGEAEAKYEKLLSDGKIVPAQKEAFMALSELEAEVQLSDNVTKSADVLLSELFEAMPNMRLLSEDGDGKGAGDGEDDVTLTSDEQSLTELGVSEDDLKETKRQEKGA